ncbi:MAG: Flp pilus assembly protein CpaB [Caulobacteraceae bacterium]
MGAVRIIVLAVALVAAIGLALMVRGPATPKRAPAVAAAPAVAEKPMARVLVAKRDLGIGNRIEKGDVDWQDWPLEALNPAFITDGAAPPPKSAPVNLVAPKDAKPAKTDPAQTAAKALAPIINQLSGAGALEQVTGAIVREPILAGEPVVERKIVRNGQGGYMAVVLQPGMRAMSVPVTVETGAGGFILPGDRVDLVQARRVDKAGGGGQETTSQVLMRNLKVLAIDQKTSPEKDQQSLVGTTATLEVAAADVDVVAKAKSMGDLMLALRSYADVGGPAGRAIARDNSGVIRVIRAGQISQTVAAQ